MNKGLVILCLVLALAMLGGSLIALNLVTDKVSEKTENKTEDTTQEKEEKDPLVETLMEVTDDGDVVTQLDTGNFIYGYIRNESSGKVVYGIFTDELKAKTKYCIDWTIDAGALREADWAFFKDDNGYYVCFDTSYAAGEGLGTKLSAGSEWVNLLDNSWSFTSENAGDLMSLVFFEADWVDEATAQECCDVLKENLSFTIERLE